jgi:hypothetical protein
MRKTLIALAATAAAVTAMPASAAIIIQSGAGFVQPAENVLTDTTLTAQTVFGTTNQTNTKVSVASLNSDLLTTTASNGQARFETTDGSLDTANIFLTDGGTFTQAEFNLFNARQGTTSVQISVNGGAAQTFTLGNGENFFGFNATGGDAITSITFDTNGSGVVDLRQLRVGGIGDAVPEPATWAMMLGGFGVMGLSMRRRRRTNVAIA